MFCPICSMEFREGFTWCPECQASLVDELPAVETPERNELASVFEGDAGSAAVVCAMLEGTGIEAWIKDEEAHGVLPNLGPVKVLVHGVNKKAALETVEMPGREASTNYDDSHISSRNARNDTSVRNTAGARDLRKGRDDISRRQNHTHGKGHQGNNQRRQGRRI